MVLNQETKLLNTAESRLERFGMKPGDKVGAFLSNGEFVQSGKVEDVSTSDSGPAEFDDVFICRTESGVEFRLLRREMRSREESLKFLKDKIALLENEITHLRNESDKLQK